MNVYMTSFFKVGELPFGVLRFSAAVYQPKGYSLPKVAWTDIRDSEGRWIRPREFLDCPDPAKAYFAAMLAHYAAREEEAREWFDRVPDRDIALCCWCPHDRAAQRQLQEFGSFICHTGPLGVFIQSLGHVVWNDYERRLMYAA